MQGIPLVVQWLGLSVPLQGPWIRSPVGELSHVIQPKKKKQKISREKNQLSKHPGLFPGVGQASQVVLGLFMGLMFPQQGNMASEVYRETAVPIKHLITYSY